MIRKSRRYPGRSRSPYQKVVRIMKMSTQAQQSQKAAASSPGAARPRPKSRPPPPPKPKCKPVNVVLDDAGQVSPLRTLQRMKESGGYKILPKIRSPPKDLVRQGETGKDSSSQSPRDVTEVEAKRTSTETKESENICLDRENENVSPENEKVLTEVKDEMSNDNKSEDVVAAELGTDDNGNMREGKGSERTSQSAAEVSQGNFSCHPVVNLNDLEPNTELYMPKTPKGGTLRPPSSRPPTRPPPPPPPSHKIIHHKEESPPKYTAPSPPVSDRKVQRGVKQDNNVDKTEPTDKNTEVMQEKPNDDIIIEQCKSLQTTDPERIGYVDFTPIPKPVIEVKLWTQNKLINRFSKSSEQLLAKYYGEDKYRKVAPYATPRVGLRDSFMVNDNRESIYHSIGDVQTILKSFVDDEERIYTLPQPLCYGESTLKAVKNITEKYDTLERRKIRAMSFRENTYSRARSASDPTSPKTEEDSALPVLGEDSTDGMERVDVCISSGITARDMARLDLFYHGRDSEVVVCQCLADLTLGTPSPDGETTTWDAIMSTGVPVLVFNTGEGKRRRELYVTLAERETGFPIWQDRINYLSNYHDACADLHVFQLSNNLRRLAGLRFYSETAAAEFLERFQAITSDPNDDLWKVSSDDRKEKKRTFLRRCHSKRKSHSKSDISQPCNFSHITKVDPSCESFYECFCDLLSKTPKTENEQEQKDDFRSRLPTT